MNVTQSGASRSRDVASARAFFPVPVNPGTSSELNPSVYGWKLGYLKRIWATDFPDRVAARGVLTVLWEHSDEDGRTWIGLNRLAAEAGIGNLRTVRNALAKLAQGGWLRFTPQTWASLTAEQNAARRPAPRRGDVGQATHLYELLDPRVKPVTSAAHGSRTPTRPGLVVTKAEPSEGSADETPGQNCPGGLEQNCPGGPVAKLLHDPDPIELTPRKEREARVALVSPDTHLFSQGQGSKGDWLDAWNLLIRMHAEKTKAVYSVAPLPPDLKRDQCQAVAECLDGTALDLAAKLRERGMVRELVQVRQDLAARVMTLYFKRDNEHLRRVKHALRDLPREFHARIIEAMQLILRENHDSAKSPRQTAVLELEQTVRPKVEKAAEVAKIEVTEKPIPQAMQANTAREARRIMEVLSATPSREEPSKASKTEPAPRATKATLAEGQVAERKPEQARTEPQRPKESDNDRATGSQTVQRSIGRPGAPRWGALAPTPTRVRRVSRLQLAEPEEATESAEPHPRE